MSVTEGALERLIGSFDGRSVAVVGDVMLDHFVYGSVHRISPEAPVPVIEFDRETFRLGGAANVAHNLRALGAKVTLVGVVGEDEASRRLLEEATALGLPAAGFLRTADRPTTRKMRVVTTRNQQIARVDYEEDADIDGALEKQVIERAVMAVAGADAVVASDYLKGVITARLMSALVEAASRCGIPLLVDPKIPHIDCYKGATLVTPNQHEAETATAMRIRSNDDARTAARLFRQRAGCESVLITRGEQGMWLLEGDADSTDDAIRTELALAAAAREVADVTGAGDTVIATIALALAAGASPEAAATLANHAAGISVSKFGPATVDRDELRAALSVHREIKTL